MFVNKVRIYLDGLNFYYGIARAYNFKWIDVEKLLKCLIKDKLPSFEIEKIFLFTSTVMGKSKTSGPAARQGIYLKALMQHSPCIKLILGRFQINEKSGELVAQHQELAGKPPITRVKIREEKSTDVNLACQIVDDAHTTVGKDFNVACLVTNDSDIACALKVKQRLRQRTILILPRSTRNASPTSKELIKLVAKKDRVAVISRGIVRQCPLPNPLGQLYAPDAPGWSTS